jgi:hypothetical protein
MVKETKGGKISIVANNGGGRHAGGSKHGVPYYYKITAPKNPKTRVIDPFRYTFDQYKNMTDWLIIDGFSGKVIKPAGIKLTTPQL